MAGVEIEYCVPCGLLDDAIETRRALLEEYGQDLDAVTLSPGHGGVFEVSVDGDIVYDRDEAGGYDREALREAVRARIGDPA